MNPLADCAQPIAGLGAIGAKFFAQLSHKTAGECGGSHGLRSSSFGSMLHNSFTKLSGSCNRILTSKSFSASRQPGSAGNSDLSASASSCPSRRPYSALWNPSSAAPSMHCSEPSIFARHQFGHVRQVELFIQPEQVGLDVACAHEVDASKNHAIYIKQRLDT